MNTDLFMNYSSCKISFPTQDSTGSFHHKGSRLISYTELTGISFENLMKNLRTLCVHNAGFPNSRQIAAVGFKRLMCL